MAQHQRSGQRSRRPCIPPTTANSTLTALPPRVQRLGVRSWGCEVDTRSEGEVDARCRGCEVGARSEGEVDTRSEGEVGARS